MKYTLGLSLLLSSVAALGQSKPFDIKGTINNWKSKEQVALLYTLDNQTIGDTTFTVDGKFQFTGELPETTEVSVVRLSGTGKGARDFRTFFLDGGKVALVGTDSLKTSRVSGPRVTLESEELASKIKPLFDRFLALRLKAMAMSKEEREAADLTSLQKEGDSLINAMIDVQMNFIAKHPESYISLYNLAKLADNPSSFQKIIPLFEGLSPKLKKSTLGLKLGKAFEVAKKTSLGVKMPDFTSLDTLRKPLSLYEIVQKGKVTLVDFWASWCVPCRAENPNLVKAYQAFNNKGFNIISISLDASEAAWKGAIAKDGMPWYHVSGLKGTKEPVAIEFGINAIPDSFLLDENGKVIARALRGEALFKKIEEILN